MTDPTVGRIVMYQCTTGDEYLMAGEDKLLPAIVTRVIGGPMRGVDLTVFTNQPSTLVTRRCAVPYGLNNGGWKWPMARDNNGTAAIPETVDNKPVDSPMEQTGA